MRIDYGAAEAYLVVYSASRVQVEKADCIIVVSQICQKQLVSDNV